MATKVESNINVAIVGLGKASVTLRQTFQSAPFQISYCYDHNESLDAPEECGHRAMHFYELLDSAAGIQLVVIATPPVSHFDLAHQAIMAGKHLLIEKPTTLNLQQTQVLIALAKENNCMLLTHFNRRWDADYLRVQSVLSAKLIGTPQHLESRVSDHYLGDAQYLGRRDWKLKNQCGGILLDWAPHLLDQLFTIFPSEFPLSIYCSSHRPNQLVEKEVEEQFVIVLRYSDKTVLLSASWNATIAPNRWYVAGNKGAIRIEQMSENELNERLCYRNNLELIDELTTFPRHSNSAKKFAAFVLQCLNQDELQQAELLQMQYVSYAIDLAKLSAANNCEQAWELNL